MNLKHGILLLGCAMIATAGGAFFLLSQPPIEAAPLTHEAYVWQRRWTPEVPEAITRAAPLLDGFCIEAAEIKRHKGKLEIQRAQVDWQALAASPRRLGIAWRVGADVIAAGWDQAVCDRLRGIIQDTLKEAQEHGVRVSEAQLDCDCPTRLLPGYASFLQSLHGSASEVAWTFTALPSWLRHPSFQKLAHASDGFVLQVHWLRPKSGHVGPPTLMNLDESRLAVARAARCGVAFRVALPTYGSAVVCDAEGRWLEVMSEDRLALPAGSHLEEALASPEDCLQLMKEWRTQRPAHLTGIVWYRLPIATDRRNWSWPQLQAVIAGHRPAASFAATLQANPEGWEDLLVQNIGDGDATLPRRIVLTAEGIRAADGVFQYHAQENPESVTFATAQSLRLPSGRRVSIGWVRRDHPDLPPQIHLDP